MSPDVVGYRALGRHGELGVVVRAGRNGARMSVLVVRGGVSEGLEYLVPWERVRAVSARDRHVVLDVDLEDFSPRLRDDGTVELLMVQD